MAIEEKEQQETLLKNLIEKIEKDPLPTNVYTKEDTDPLVLLGKLNEVIAWLKQLQGYLSDEDSEAKEALNKAIEALELAQTADSTAIEAINDATQALTNTFTNKNLIDALTTRVTANEELAQNATEDIIAINTKDASQDNEISNLNLKITNAEAKNTEQDSKITAIEAKNTEQDTAIAQNTADIDSIVNTGLDVDTAEAIEKAYGFYDQFKSIYPTENRTYILIDKGNLWGSEERPDNIAYLKIDGRNSDRAYRSNALSIGIGDDTNSIKVIPSGSVLFMQINKNKVMPINELGNYDANTLYDAGLYQISSGSNLPSGSQYGTLLVLTYRKGTGNSSPDYAVQIFIPNGDDKYTSSFYYRCSLQNGWLPWKCAFSAPKDFHTPYGGSEDNWTLQLGDGWKINYGTHKTGTVTFSDPFINKPIMFACSINRSGGTASGYNYCSSVTNTSMYIQVGTEWGYWWALGR